MVGERTHAPELFQGASCPLLWSFTMEPFQTLKSRWLFHLARWLSRGCDLFIEGSSPSLTPAHPCILCSLLGHAGCHTWPVPVVTRHGGQRAHERVILGRKKPSPSETHHLVRHSGPVGQLVGPHCQHSASGLDS